MSRVTCVMLNYDLTVRRRPSHSSVSVLEIWLLSDIQSQLIRPKAVTDYYPVNFVRFQLVPKNHRRV